jgi:hypothetical protein
VAVAAAATAAVAARLHPSDSSMRCKQAIHTAALTLLKTICTPSKPLPCPQLRPTPPFYLSWTGNSRVDGWKSGGRKERPAGDHISSTTAQHLMSLVNAVPSWWLRQSKCIEFWLGRRRRRRRRAFATRAGSCPPRCNAAPRWHILE